jgi:hypothetical protein
MQFLNSGKLFTIGVSYEVWFAGRYYIFALDLQRGVWGQPVLTRSAKRPTKVDTRFEQSLMNQTHRRQKHCQKHSEMVDKNHYASDGWMNLSKRVRIK